VRSLGPLAQTPHLAARFQPDGATEDRDRKISLLKSFTFGLPLRSAGQARTGIWIRGCGNRQARSRGLKAWPAGLACVAMILLPRPNSLTESSLDSIPGAQPAGASTKVPGEFLHVARALHEVGEAQSDPVSRSGSSQHGQPAPFVSSSQKTRPAPLRRSGLLSFSRGRKDPIFHVSLLRSLLRLGGEHEHGRSKFLRSSPHSVASRVRGAGCSSNSFLPESVADRSSRVSRIRQAILKREYDWAWRLAEELAKTEQKNHEGYFWKGYIQAQRQELYAAVLSLRAAERLRPEGNAVAKLLAHCYDLLDQSRLFGRKMQEAAEIDPRDSAPHHYLGRNAANNLRYEEARSHFEAALQRNPADYLSCFELGYCLELSGLPEKARQHYELSIEQAEVCGVALSLPFAGLGRIALASGELARAHTLANQAIELEPNSAAHRMLLGQVLMKTGRVEEAAAQLRAAITLDPTASSLYYLLYQCYLKSGDKSRGEATLAEFKKVLSYYGEGTP